MDKGLRKMLVEAERIRRKGNHGPHAGHLAKMLHHGQSKKLFTGNALDGTASEEQLSLATEMAAGTLEFFHNEKVGSVLNFSLKAKIRLCKRAKKKAEAHIKLMEEIHPELKEG